MAMFRTILGLFRKLHSHLILWSGPAGRHRTPGQLLAAWRPWPRASLWEPGRTFRIFAPPTLKCQCAQSKASAAPTESM